MRFDSIVLPVPGGPISRRLCPSARHNKHLTLASECIRKCLHIQDLEYESVEQMLGSMSHRSCPEPAAFERAHYMKALAGYR